MQTKTNELIWNFMRIQHSEFGKFSNISHLLWNIHFLFASFQLFFQRLVFKHTTITTDLNYYCMKVVFNHSVFQSFLERTNKHSLSANQNSCFNDKARLLIDMRIEHVFENLFTCGNTGEISKSRREWRSAIKPMVIVTSTYNIQFVL